MKWISVEDRLPDEVRTVLAFTRGEVRALYVSFDGEWHSDYSDYDITFPVTHWMPLPDPPVAIKEE